MNFISESQALGTQSEFYKILHFITFAFINRTNFVDLQMLDLCLSVLLNFSIYSVSNINFMRSKTETGNSF